jgi:hypothetical protein
MACYKESFTLFIFYINGREGPEEEQGGMTSGVKCERHDKDAENGFRRRG